MFVDSLSSRSALVTGADGGVGLALAGQLAAVGWTVIVHTDTAEAGDQAVERLVRAGADPTRLQVVSADFTRLGQVARMARQVSEWHPGLDLLVNTAHTVPGQRRVLTEDGHERTFQTNYLAPFLLVRLLSGPLIKVHGRIVSRSSILHRGARLAWTGLTRAEGIHAAGRLRAGDARAHHVHPGARGA